MRSDVSVAATVSYSWPSHTVASRQVVSATRVPGANAKAVTAHSVCAVQVSAVA